MATTAEVVPLPTAAAPTISVALEAKQSDKKFSPAVMSHGAFIVPAMMLRAQARLLVNSTQMIVLLQLLDFWWAEDSSAHPSMQTISERVTLTPKQVQRTINELIKKGLITKINRTLPGRGKTSNSYKFDGLIAKLKSFEPDFAEARRQRQAAAKPGGIKANLGAAA